MPKLPSGQHVAVDPAPLRELISGSSLSHNAHLIMQIQQVDDLNRWVDVLTLCPSSEVPIDRRNDLRSIEGAPIGYVGVPLGRLSQWENITMEWEDQDRKAFRAFLDERVRNVASVAWWKSVSDCRERLLKTPSVAGALAAMWQFGVHPLQDTDE